MFCGSSAFFVFSFFFFNFFFSKEKNCEESVTIYLRTDKREKKIVFFKFFSSSSLFCGGSNFFLSRHQNTLNKYSLSEKKKGEFTTTARE